MDTLKQNLIDAGCSDIVISEIENYINYGMDKEILIALKKQRCSLIAEIHKQQKKIDCLDYLIRKQESGGNQK